MSTARRKVEVKQMILGNFKTFTADRLDLDELVSLSAFGKSLRQEYEAHQVEVPEFVATQLNALTREIKGRVADKVEARRKQISSQLESLRTPAERRAQLEAELARIDGVPVGA